MRPLLAPASAPSGPPVPRAATEPPEARGLSRDGVRLLVAQPERLEHREFHDLPRWVAPGDLVVVNTSATLPAALDGRRQDGAAVVVHVATELDVPGEWVVELRRPDGRGPVTDGRPGEEIHLPGDSMIRLEMPRHNGRPGGGVRLWRAHAKTDADFVTYLAAHGRPITYDHARGRWPLATYQPIFARHPGSAEMASAGRPFTPDLTVELVTRGIIIAPVTLHAGVSSLEEGEPPEPERFAVPPSTAALVNHVRGSGGRVVAVGTTVTRALESAVGSDGRVEARRGWTDLVLGSDRAAHVVTGLVTGWHDAGSSHLDLLRAVAGEDLVSAAYVEAHAQGYRWHEFGDACLFLP